MMNSIVLVVAHCTPKVSGDGKLCCDEVEEVGVEEEVEEGTGRVYVDIKVCNVEVSPINVEKGLVCDLIRKKEILVTKFT